MRVAREGSGEIDRKWWEEGVWGGIWLVGKKGEKGKAKEWGVRLFVLEWEKNVVEELVAEMWGVEEGESEGKRGNHRNK